jgi:hypothetical protein
MGASGEWQPHRQPALSCEVHHGLKKAWIQVDLGMVIVEVGGLDAENPQTVDLRSELDAQMEGVDTAGAKAKLLTADKSSVRAKQRGDVARRREGAAARDVQVSSDADPTARETRKGRRDVAKVDEDRGARQTTLGRGANDCVDDPRVRSEIVCVDDEPLEHGSHAGVLQLVCR